MIVIKGSDNNMEDLKELMFPEGKPEPDEFIIALTELAKQIRELKSDRRD